MIAVIDYGMGNLFNIHNGLIKVGAEAEIITDPEKLSFYDGIVIPGVGSFGEVMLNLKPFVPTILDLVRKGVPLLGICLGMQVLFEDSEEGEEKGLGLIDGRVKRLSAGVRIPHMGWNSINIRKGTDLLNKIENGTFFFFAHSYFCEPGEDVVVATVEYGTDVPVMVAKDNVYGVQFHPEKSGDRGLRVLENWVEICKSNSKS
ncbi:MAG: imidazole glycerol phosphate synthase subunit HisH [Halobacteriota archaeon]|nr:imidazole glycerol phosphate synthase subunit HisH [Halobacteriota archaeon]